MSTDKKTIKEPDPKNLEILNLQNKDLPPNPNIPTVYSDLVSVTTMPADNVIMLRWFSKTPGAHLEQCRIVITAGLAAKVTEILSNTYDVAEKPKPKKK